MSRVAVVGLGYVGLPLAVRAAEAGHTVVGLDIDADKVAAVNAAQSYVGDVSDDRLRQVIGAQALRAFTPWRVEDPAIEVLDSFDVGLITVPTPLRGGRPDLSYVAAAARILGRWLSPGATVILESSTYPGTTEGLVASIIHEESGLKPESDYHLGCSPERIDPGNTVHTFETTPKVVSGTDEAALERVQAFYDSVVDHTVPVSSPKAAELTKLFENIFSQVNIALVNEMATLAHDLDIDIWEVIDAADTKPHGFLKHTPGPGVGGHCIPIDPLYMTWLAREELGRPFRLSELAQEINDSMPSYVVRRAEALLAGGLRGAKVLVLGVAYKPGSDDTRAAPAHDIVRLLEEQGADVTVSDPHVTSWDRTPTLPHDSVVSEASAFSLILVVTNHAEFDFSTIASAAPLVLDCRRCVPPSANVRYL